MCIIVYKPQNTEFPSYGTLERCFKANSDGAGFMYSDGESVHIRKGFMKWSDFKKAIKSARKIAGDDRAFVMHFRIGTQGGNTKENCHPFPLSSNMEELRYLNCKSDIGVAHNGIISLTTAYYGKSVDYSDTMKFITDYLSLIVRGREYYKDKKTLTLIERLCESKLAILDGAGHCELIGDFIEDSGIYYSNSSYKSGGSKKTASGKSYSAYGYSGIYADYYDYYDPYDYGTEISKYNCPVEEIGETIYCADCIDFDKCSEVSKYDSLCDIFGACKECRAKSECMLAYNR